MKPYFLIPLILAPWPGCRTVLPSVSPLEGPFAAQPREAFASGPVWLCWLAAGLALGICLAWLYRRFLLQRGIKKDRARAGAEELELAQNAQDSTEEVLRSLPRRDVVLKLAGRLKGKRDKKL